MPHKDNTPELTDQEVLRHAQDLLEEKLSLHAEGYQRTTDGLLKVLLGVTATQGTLKAVCADVVGTPDPHTIRGYLNEQLRVEELPKLEQQLNAALAAAVPRCAHYQAQEVAIITMTGPTTAKRHRTRNWGCGAKPKMGRPASIR